MIKRLFYRWRIPLTWLGLFLYFPLTQSVVDAQENVPLKSNALPNFVMIQYEGGTWEHSKEEQLSHVKNLIPNYLNWLRRSLRINISESVTVLKLSDNRIFNYPMLFLNGHFDAKWTPEEKNNLKEYILRGGFLHIEDCGGTEKAYKKYGRFADQIHGLLKELFPDGEFRVLPKDHEIYRQPFRFPNGLPNFCGAENDIRPETSGKKRKGKGGEGFYYQDTMVAFYSDADCCCALSNSKASSWMGENPCKIMANVMFYAMGNAGR